MKINGSLFEPLRPTPTGTPVTRPAQTPTPSPSDRSARADSVQISDAGRRLQAQREDLDPERVAELRQKVLTGAYNTLDVVDQVARRILTRGDL